MRNVLAVALIALSVVTLESRRPVAQASIVNVRDFGAFGNGVSNDAPAIQAAINALASGQTLYLPAGTYLLATSAGGFPQYPDGSLIQSALILRQGGVSVQGDGRSLSVLKLAAHTKMRALTTTSVDVSMRDFAVDGNKSQRDGTQPWPYADVVDALVYFTDTTARISVSRCEVSNGVEDGLGFWMTDTATVDGCWLHDNGTPQAGAAGLSFSGSIHSTASNNQIERNGTGIGTAFSSHDVTLAGNTIRDQTKEGIVIGQFVAGGGLGENSGYLVSGNLIEGNGSTGFAAVSVASASSGAIESNTIINNLFDGVQLYNLPTTPPSVGWSITSNTCSDTRQKKKRTQDWGIRVLAQSGADIRGNICENNGTSLANQIGVDSSASVNADWPTANTRSYH